MPMLVWVQSTITPKKPWNLEPMKKQPYPIDFQISNLRTFFQMKNPAVL
jgi:hypothetical protein